jgi:hypothetical protein
MKEWLPDADGGLSGRLEQIDAALGKGHDLDIQHEAKLDWHRLRELGNSWGNRDLQKKICELNYRHLLQVERVENYDF